MEAIAAARVPDTGTGTGTEWASERASKRECLWQEALALDGVGSQINLARRVYRLTEQSIDKHGNTLLLPEYTLEGWTTKLPEN